MKIKFAIAKPSFNTPFHEKRALRNKRKLPACNIHSPIGSSQQEGDGFLQGDKCENAGSGLCRTISSGNVTSKTLSLSNTGAKCRRTPRDSPRNKAAMNEPGRAAPTCAAALARALHVTHARRTGAPLADTWPERVEQRAHDSHRPHVPCKYTFF
ncbi:hypothetical protein F2P79_024039 [Pimephales promelas]|nr:hypothetical protein F2P79_024039 [Pimephales promelas]